VPEGGGAVRRQRCFRGNRFLFEQMNSAGLWSSCRLPFITFMLVP
jgi:hypothetical protein